ncbi:DUF1345 domain-containing protein [Roseomonas sp. CCTCC AB2023176]|uniref:DUF1345 domain-containing protein n=1 Tax=Roseomonas sp. CCTCC AB2023176 TaxID=3342640 RepID=UPI0035D75B91
MTLGRRPALLIAIGCGVIGAAVAAIAGVRGTGAAVIGWDASVIAYLASLLPRVWAASPEAMARRAGELEGSRWTVLTLSAAAAVASLVAVVADLAVAKGTPGAGAAAALAGGTVILSWCFVQVIFAHHYAHEHLLHGGLSFPGNDRPDFPEFLYFAMTVGMTAQVSDVTTTTPAMRRVVLGHAALAFLFNAVVLAAAVNLAAALVG